MSTQKTLTRDELIESLEMAAINVPEIAEIVEDAIKVIKRKQRNKDSKKARS